MFGCSGLRRFLRAEGGTASFEMLIWTVVVLVPVASVIDVGIYVVQDLQLRAAAQAAAQQIRATCRNEDPPYTTNCSGMATAATTGAQRTGLGTAVTVDSSYPIEGYYCTKTSDSLLYVVGTEGTVSTAPTRPDPFNCSAYGNNRADMPGVYIRVKTNHTYTPMFPNISIASLLPSAMAHTSWIRMQ